MMQIIANIPIIETERLILREPRYSDLPPLADFHASARSRFVGGPMDACATSRAIYANIGHWAVNGFGFWYVTLKGDDKLIGRVGFLYSEGWAEPELGWQVFEGYEGKGFAYEAAVAARGIGAAKLGLDGVISYIAKGNLRSAALAERLGATIESETVFFDTPCHIWRHPKQAEAH